MGLIIDGDGSLVSRVVVIRVDEFKMYLRFGD